MENFDIVGTVARAYRSIFDHPRAFLTVAVPILVLAIVAKEFLPAPGTQGLGLAGVGLSLATLVIFVYLKLVLALTWHRAVLLGRRGSENLFGLTTRLWRFFRYGLLYALVVAIPGLVLGALLAADAPQTSTPGELMEAHPALFLWTGAGQLALTVFVIARFGFVFPAASIDRPTSLVTAWRQSAGLVVPFCLIAFCALAPFAAANHGLGYALQGDVGPAIDHVLFAISVVVDYIGFLVLISAVSLVYAWQQKLSPDKLS